jgi:uncharacterized protein YycO
MKTAILTAAMIILMTAANASAYTDTISMTGSPEQNFKAWVTQIDNNIIKFRVKNPAEERVVLKIYNDEMVKIFQRTVKSEKELNLGCDLSKCGTGTYTCIVKRNGKEEIRKQITLN